MGEDAGDGRGLEGEGRVGYFEFWPKGSGLGCAIRRQCNVEVDSFSI